MTSEDPPSSTGYQVDKDIAVSKEVWEEDLRNRIKLIVKQIKTNRNRPSYQNIYDHLTRDTQYQALEKNADVIPLFDTMVSDGFLSNIGREKESFAVVSELPVMNSTEKTPNEECTNAFKEQNDGSHPNEHMVEAEKDEDQQLHVRLNEFMIKVLSAVDSKIEERLMNLHLQNHVNHQTTPRRSSTTTPRQLPRTPMEVETLREEIKGLRDQLKEKDRLIFQQP